MQDPTVPASVELLPDRPIPNILRYRIECYTSDMRGSGTDSNIYLEMHGTLGKLGPERLDMPGAFDRGQGDVFHMEGADLGRLTKLSSVSCPVGSRDARANRVTLSRSDPRWLSQVRKRTGPAPPGPNPVTRPGTPGLPTSPRFSPAAHVSPKPSPSKPAQPPGLRASYHQVAPRSPQQPVSLSASQASPLQPAKAGRAAKARAAGAGSQGGWSAWVVFPCQRWFSVQVMTVTSDLRGASTDANVYLVMHGTLGDGSRHLLTSGHDDFNRGATNTFIVDDENLGELLEVTVGHDSAGHSPSWHLDHLTITNTKTE
ncbi:uncharacterized protein HaLaN_08491, partial [Haematococcus lacustris]